MPLNITSGDQPISVDRTNILIYAPPGNGKTSLGFSAKEPLLLDFDNGAHRSGFRRDAVIMENWSETANITPEDMAPYNTIIIDTVGRALDMLTAFLQEQNPKLRTRAGGLTLQGYGELKASFAAWIKQLQSLGKDIVMIAHDREDKRGEQTVLRADVQGGSYSEIFKLADGVGYLSIGAEGKRYLDFSPSETHSGKNPANLPIIEIPDLNQNPNILAEIIQQTKDAVGSIGIESKLVADEVNKLRKKINKAKTAKDMNKLRLLVNDVDRAAVKAQARKLMATRLENIDVTFDKDADEFVSVEKPAKKDKAA